MDLAWRAEEVGLNVRPSPVEVFCEGWLIRASGGPVRRTNSIWPTRYHSKQFEAVLETGEDIFRRLKRPSIVKVLSISGEMDDLLNERGYEKEGESHVLFAEHLLDHVERSAVELSVGGLEEEWFEAWSEVGKPATPIAASAFRRSMDAIILPKAYAAYRADGQIVSIAYGVIHSGLLAVDAVATMPEHRGKGYARQVIARLHQWAQGQGVRSSCLAVLANNNAAQALYRRCGFNRHLYSYHYRVAELSQYSCQKKAQATSKKDLELAAQRLKRWKAQR